MKEIIKKIRNKFKNKKFKLQFISFVGAISITLSGCALKKDSVLDENKLPTEPMTNQSITDNNPEFNYTNNYNEITTNIELQDKEFYTNLLSKKITINQLEYNDFTEKLANINVNYDYSELFKVKEFLNLYNTRVQYNGQYLSKGIIINRKIDSNKLYNLVSKNNEQYLQNNSGIAKKYSDTTDKLVRDVCAIITNYINDYLIKYPETNIEELEDKLYNLKVFENGSFTYAYYNSDTCIMGVSTPTIEALEKNNQDPLTFKKVIEHEVNHIIHSATQTELRNSSYSIRFGPCYNFEELEVNSGYWNWYFEGGAEKFVSQYNQSSPLTFQFNNLLMDIIKSGTILKEGNTVETFNKLSMQSNLDLLFEYFGCTSEEDKEEVVKLMYSINLITHDNSNSSTAEFHDFYQKKYGSRMDYSTRTELSYSHYASIAQSLSKYFYRDLQSRLVNQEVKLEDVFYNMYVFEQEMHRLTKYTNNSRMGNNFEFMSNYLYIQDNFLELIADSTGISYDDIRGAYDYYFSTKDKRNSASYLTDEEQLHYLNQINSNPSIVNSSVFSVYNNYLLISTKG